MLDISSIYFGALGMLSLIILFVKMIKFVVYLF